MTNGKNTIFDPRVYLFLMFGCILAGLVVYHEVMLAFIFAISAVWLILALKGEKLFSYLIGYTVMWGITRICVFFLAAAPTNTIAILFSNIGIIGRKAFPAMIFALIVAKQPTGSLLASLYAMRLPKAVGIGVGFWHTFKPAPCSCNLNAVSRLTSTQVPVQLIPQHVVLLGFD